MLADMSSPEIDRARTDLGSRLRHLRRSHRLTGHDLARLAGWDGAKVSRFEHGKQLPTPDDIDTWCTLTESRLQIPDLLAAVRTIDAAEAEWRRTAHRRRQHSVPRIDTERLAGIEHALSHGGHVDAGLATDLRAAGLPELAAAIESELLTRGVAATPVSPPAECTSPRE